MKCARGRRLQNCVYEKHNSVGAETPRDSENGSLRVAMPAQLLIRSDLLNFTLQRCLVVEGRFGFRFHAGLFAAQLSCGLRPQHKVEDVGAKDGKRRMYGLDTETIANPASAWIVSGSVGLTGGWSGGDVSCPFVEAFLEVVEHVIAVAHGERDDGHCRGLVCAVREDTRVANIKICHVVGLSPLVGDRSLGIASETADSRFVQAGSGAVRLDAGAP